MNVQKIIAVAIHNFKELVQSESDIQENITKFDNVSSNIFIVQLPGTRSSWDSTELRKMNTVLLLNSGGRALFFVSQKATSISSVPV